MIGIRSFLLHYRGSAQKPIYLGTEDIHFAECPAVSINVPVKIPTLSPKGIRGW